MARQSTRAAAARVTRSVAVEKTGDANASAVAVTKVEVVKKTRAERTPVEEEADGSDKENPSEEEETAKKPTPEKRKAKSTTVKEAEEEFDEEAEDKKLAAKKRKAKSAKEEDEEVVEDEEAEAKKPAPKKRKVKSAAEKEAEAVPLAQRTAVTSLKRAMHIGAHVSAAGGVENSISNAVQIGANSFALFLKSQRKWVSPALTGESVTAFSSAAQQHKFDAGRHVLPHGSYLVNLAQADAEKAKQAYGNFVDDLLRCDQLGIGLYNFHPGSTGGAPMEDATGRIAAQLNKAHAETKTVVTLLENMCGSGNIVGSRFEDLRDIIAKVEDQSRVGVCLDTCHAFAAGYDLRTPEAFQKTMADFDEIVGLKYLKALHLNDSKAPFGSHRDLHANIGTGFLGLRAFHNVMNFAHFEGLPMVLETPIDEKGADGKAVENKQVWADEIKLLELLVGVEWGDDLLAQSVKLQAKGASERAKVQEQVDKKAAKDAKKLGDKAPSKSIKDFFAGKGKGPGKADEKAKAKPKARKKRKDESEAEDEDGCGSCEE